MLYDNVEDTQEDLAHYMSLWDAAQDKMANGYTPPANGIQQPVNEPVRPADVPVRAHDSGNSVTDTKDDLAYYTNLWDAAQDKMANEPIHPHNHEIQPPQEISATDLLNERRKAESNDEMPFSDMILVAENIDRVFHPERFNEAARKSKAAITDISHRAAGSPNPVEKWTIGKDQDLRVTPNFSDGEALRELSELKVKFEVLEREIHGANVRGEEKQENNLSKQLQSLRSKLEELSDKITPHQFDL